MPTKIALLPSRGVLSLTGPDARKLLQGVITNDVERLDTDGALHAGLLSPQGKILFDMFVVPAGNALLIETSKGSVQALKQRLDMYRLRANAQISDASANYTVAVAWHVDGSSTSQLTGAGETTVVFTDPRVAGLGERHLVSLKSNWHRELAGTEVATETEYGAHCVALGVPQAGVDFELGDTFPHEALYDQTRSVSFTKGCYVGQEVVSRMQHRGTARKRIVRLVAESTLPETGTAVRAGEIEIGRLGSVAGNLGLGLVRLDRAAELAAKGLDLRTGDIPVRIELPAWVDFPLVPPGSTSAS